MEGQGRTSGDKEGRGGVWVDGPLLSGHWQLCACESSERAGVAAEARHSQVDRHRDHQSLCPAITL